MNEEEKKAIKIINDYIERKRATRTVFNTEDIIFDNIIILLGLLEKQTELEERNKKDYISKDKIRELLKSKDIELTGVISYRELEELLEEN
jgi:hypothetical protein